jgi:cytochrome c-type biogenesis protein CcmH/NrfF
MVLCGRCRKTAESYGYRVEEPGIPWWIGPVIAIVVGAIIWLAVAWRF